MHPNWIREIVSTISNFKDEIPAGRILFENSDSMKAEQFLPALNELFILEEAAIKKEHSKPYVTDTYENNVRYFARQLVKTVISNHNELKEDVDYRILLGQRHVAYGFYSTFGYGLEYGHDVLKDSSFEKSLYLGLVAFYKNFYGKFSDNEEAIELLCKFYPKEDGLHENKDDIVSAIFNHITNAGTSGDSGFAYRGIELIRKNIVNLPIEIIDKLLQKYELYRIINQKVYRHQIFTIIDNSRMTNEEKQKYKFNYLDSLLLANCINESLYEKYGKQYEYLSRYYNQFRNDLTVDKIGLINNDNKDNIYAYWTNDCSTQRHFILNEKIIININLDIDQKQICIKYTDKPTVKAEFEFKYGDWMLDGYHSKETEQELKDFVFEARDGEEIIVYHDLTFSLLYLNCFRGMSDQLVDFDHQFTYDKATNEIRASINSHVIPHFYGNKVHSLSCIVGKNGTGKSSTVDFLRGTFFRLLHLIGEYGVACENGYVSEVNYEAFNILDKGCEFFVVFHLGSRPYYLTNREAVNETIVKPFDLNAYKSVNELSKIVYFSNMLSVNQDSLYVDQELISRQKESTEDKLAKSLSNFRQADYSEAASFIQKQKAIEVAKQKDNSNSEVNKDLCYQLAFLGYLTQEKLEDYFDMPVGKEFKLKGGSLGIEDMPLTVEHSLKEMIAREPQTLKLFLTAPDAKLEYFSSGQYAKFSFLSKLYWFLEGYQECIQDFELMIGNNVFSRDEALLERETALLFIDEGELYYHPEWQRSYIKTLVDNIHNTKTESKLQVVITTNSPFIISDILNEDITYLSREKKDFDRTFGQNIHKLLKENFFMDYTIGEYSRNLIKIIMGWLNDDKIDVNIGEELRRYFGESIEPKEYYEKIHCLIDKIGEPIYREKLFDMLNKSKWGYEIEVLLRRKAEIDRTIKELQEGR